MNEHDPPEPPTPVGLNPNGPVPDTTWCKEQFEIFRSDPSALDRLQSEPSGYAVLRHLAEYTDAPGDKNLAVTWLAVMCPKEPTLKTFLFDELLRGKRFSRSATLYGILANYAADESAIRELAAVFRDQTTGDAAYLLLDCFRFSPPQGTIHAAYKPPLGVSEQAWEDYQFAVTSAQLHPRCV